MAEITDQNLEKLQKLLAVVDEDTLTRKEFVDYFEKVVELVLNIQKDQASAIQRLEETYTRLIAKLDSDHQMNFTELKKNVNDLFVGDQLKRMDGESKASFEKRQREMNEVIDRKLRDVDDRVSKLKDGPQGVQGIPGPQGPMPTEHLQLMKDMMAEMKRVKDILANIPRGRGMGRAKVPITRWVYLTDQVDGATTTFTLAPDVVAVHGILSTQFPGQWNTTDFSFAGRTLTTNFTMQAGQTLIAVCDVLFYP